MLTYGDKLGPYEILSPLGGVAWAKWTAGCMKRRGALANFGELSISEIHAVPDEFKSLTPKTSTTCETPAR